MIIQGYSDKGQNVLDIVSMQKNLDSKVIKRGKWALEIDTKI